MRDISCNVEFITILKKNVGENFDIENPRVLNDLCDSCRKSYFSKDAVAKNKTFTVNPLQSYEKETWKNQSRQQNCAYFQR